MFEKLDINLNKDCVYVVVCVKNWFTRIFHGLLGNLLINTLISIGIPPGMEQFCWHLGLLCKTFFLIKSSSSRPKFRELVINHYLFPHTQFCINLIRRHLYLLTVRLINTSNLLLCIYLNRLLCICPGVWDSH